MAYSRTNQYSNQQSTQTEGNVIGYAHAVVVGKNGEKKLMETKLYDNNKFHQAILDRSQGKEEITVVLKVHTVNTEEFEF